MRRIIVHFHTFKNAGSTVDAMLRRTFGDQLCKFHMAGKALTSEDVFQFIAAHPQMKALTSHNIRYPLRESADLAIYSLFFLRHPIDRAGSVYDFQRKQEIDRPGVRMAKSMDFRSYVLAQENAEWAMVKNFQVRCLSRSCDETLSEEAKLEAAKRNLDESEFFGIVERFDDSLLCMKHYLQDDFPEIDYSFTVRNQNRERKASLEERLNVIAERLGAQAYQKLVEMNALDLELYEYSLTLFDRRFRALHEEAAAHAG